jgi:uncharacterized membrane protein
VKPSPAGTPFSLAVLKGTGALWFAVACSGQLLFAFYIAAYYGGSTLRGELSSWNGILAYGLMEGDPDGNAALGAHLFVAAILTALGPLQLIPLVRSKAPVFHRWNGRIYFVSGIIAAGAGAYLTWTRGALGGIINQISITGDAVAILICGVMAVRFAMAGNFERHRRWATRFFLVMSGVWFFRIMLMGWVVANRAPVGIGDELNGPVAYTIGFAHYLAPLAVYEIYWRARDLGGAGSRLAAAGMMLALTAATGFGVFAAAIGMWVPRL